MTCKVDDCGKPAKTRGYCAMHYSRLRRNGDPAISGKKRQVHMKREFIASLPPEGEGCVTWPFRLNWQGYPTFVDKSPSTPGGRGTYSATRLICERFYGPPPTPEHQAAHSCGRGHLGCVAPWHLSWKTPLENSQDKFVHGTMMRGTMHPHAKLTDEAVREIRRIAGSMSQEAIAAKYGVSQAAISRVIIGSGWRHV